MTNAQSIITRGRGGPQGGGPQPPPVTAPPGGYRVIGVR
jgi:hypothetical protein